MEDKPIKKRRRGTAIVETDQGILVAVNKGSTTFLLPGGSTKRNESRIEAAIRELREETGLIAYSAKYLFNYENWAVHKVFLIEANGEAKPRHEIAAIAYYKEGSETNPKLSRTTLSIIEKYLALRDQLK